MAVSSVRRSTTPPATGRLTLAMHAVHRLLSAAGQPRGSDRWPGGPLVIVAPGGNGASACVAAAAGVDACGFWNGPTLGRAIAAADAGDRLARLATLLTAARLVVVDAVDRLGGAARERAFADLVDESAAAGTALCVSLENHPAMAPLEPRLATRLAGGLVVRVPGTTTAAHGATPTLGRVVRQVARHWEISPDDLLGPSRRRAVATARAAGMYLARRLTGQSLGRIGTAFGGRDHTTVLHGVRVTDARRDADPAFAGELEQLAAALAGAPASRR